MCQHCGSENHTACPFRSTGSYISLDAMPNRTSLYHGEKRFEQEVAVRDRDAYKVLHDGGRTPENLRGAAAVLRKLGG